MCMFAKPDFGHFAIDSQKPHVQLTEPNVGAISSPCSPSQAPFTETIFTQKTRYSIPTLWHSLLERPSQSRYSTSWKPSV